MPAETIIKLRRGTASQWTTADPILAAGETGVETDTNKFKFGDGATAWSSLPYAVAAASGGASVDWTDVLNKPTEFTPSAHTHVKADITDFAHTHVLADVTDVTASAAEVNVLDGITATTTELNYTDGVTSNIQTQLDGKAATSHTHTSSQITDLTSNVVSRTNGTVATASTASTVVRNITLSTSDPSGGADGDVWLKYTA